MKNSKVLRGICYVLMPILIAVFILSSCYMYLINEGNYGSEQEFFNSDMFKSSYMNRIRDYMHELIFAQSHYITVQDGERTIYYTDWNNMYDMKDFMDVVVIYGNKVLTNVKFSENTDTLEEIKNVVLEDKGNNLCYENNQYSSNLENFTEDIDEYLKYDEITYYTNDNKVKEVVNIYSEDDLVIEETTEEVELVNGEEVLENTNSMANTDMNKVEYHTAKIEDFTFYSSFNKNLDKSSEISMVINTMNTLKPYHTLISISFPISAILILIMTIYLINAIGHVKGKEEIEITDFDKVPLEIIIGIFLIILIGSTYIIFEGISFPNLNMDIRCILLSTFYIVNMILAEVTGVTIIKRIKAKQFLDTSICGKILKWSWSLCKKSIKRIIDLFKKFRNKLRSIKKAFNENTNLTKKLIVIICAYIIVAVILLGVLGPIGAIIDLAVFFYAIYQVILRLNSFKKLEASLKKIYEGEKVVLNAEDFTQEFEKSITYINDISNGFENAVQESLKSERLKTELITNVSHDIKTPLTSIINYVDLIKKENVENEKVKEYIEILDNKSQRLKKLTEDLVEASKASSGNVSLNFENIGIIELLNQLLGEYKDKFEEKKLEVISNLPKEDIKIKADSRYLYRVIDNLFGNISKYALDSSRVYIDTFIKDNKINITFKNISKERLNITEEELMQRFVRGDKSRTTEGSGLGLSIAKSLTELQKGTLSCKIDGDLFKVEIEFNIA
ncbi:MAG: HAMP domain-containing histidine kinase [Clostridia bacterium]|nr:HAMP domain-containing histidine kinase [Clostridia bacterium]